MACCTSGQVVRIALIGNLRLVVIRGGGATAPPHTHTTAQRSAKRRAFVSSVSPRFLVNSPFHHKTKTAKRQRGILGKRRERCRGARCDRWRTGRTKAVLNGV